MKYDSINKYENTYYKGKHKEANKILKISREYIKRPGIEKK